MFQVAEVALLILMSALSAAVVWSLWRHQKSLRFIHPGWILTIATIFYGLVTPVTRLVAPSVLDEVAPSFVRLFDQDAYIKLLLLYVLCLAGFLFAQLTLFVAPKQRRIVKSRGGIDTKASRAAIMLISIPVLAAGAFLFYRHYAEIGGFLAFLSIESRKVAYHVISQEGGFSRYQLLFHSLFVLWSIIVFGRDGERGIKALALGFAIYATVALASGTRLEVIVTALAIGFVLYALRPQIVWRHKQHIIGLLIIVILAFSVFAHVRTNVRYFVASGVWQKPDLSLVHLFPVEAITGYVPGFIIERAGYEYFSSSYLLRPIPSTIFQQLGLVKPPTISKSLAYSLDGPSGMAVYTVTLPVDAYVGSHIVGVLVIAALLYLILYGSVSWMCKRGPMGIGAGAIIVMNTYYVVRVEVGNWFPRLWQDLLIYGFVWLAYGAIMQWYRRAGVARVDHRCVQGLRHESCRG